MNKEWISDIRLEKIAPDKKEFIGTLLTELGALSEEEKLPFVMALVSSGRMSKISFDKDELSLILTVLNDYADEGQLKRLQSMMRLLRP